MSFQRTYLADRAVQSSDATVFRQDLPKTGKISALKLGIRITNGSTSGTEQIVDAIDRIELLGNGSYPIISMTGRQAYAYTSLMLKRRPPQVRTMAVSGVQELWLLIPAGFGLWDQSRYIDLARWDQVQLAVTYSPTISATTFATGTTTFTVEQYKWSADSAPGGAGGYIRNREIFSFISGASGDQAITLPKEFPLLGLLVYAREAGIAMETDITRIRLLDGIGGAELYNRRIEDAMAENDEEMGLEAIERGSALLANAESLDTDINFPQHAIVQVRFTNISGTDYPYYVIRSNVGDRFVMSGDLIDASSPTTVNTLDTVLRTLSWEAIGRGLPHCVYLPLHHWGHPESAYPAPQKDQLILLLTQGGAGADVRVNALELAQ